MGDKEDSHFCRGREQ